jgi:small-conductance mechanosensitive channel/CRP-like cAMP-binding protein
MVWSAAVNEAVDRLWARFERFAPVWAETWGVLAALVVLVALRRMVDVDARSRTRTPGLFLLAALLFRAGVSMASSMDAGSIVGVLRLLAVLCLIVALVAMGGIVFFDLLLRRHPVPTVVRDTAQLVVVGVIFVGILYEHGFDPVSLAATGGVLTAVVGFALQSTIANVFAGVALPLEGQLAIGDWIEVDGHTGRIREMRWRSTTVVTKTGDTIILPNNQLITTTVLNYSRPSPIHRTAIRVSFHYRHPPNEVKAVLLDAVRGMPGLLAEPAPDTFPIEFAESAVTYVLRVWIDDFLRLEPIEGEVKTRVWYAARRAKLEIPYPIRTIVGASAEVEDVTGSRVAALERVDLFAPLDGESRTRLASALHEQRFGIGEDIIRQDAPGDSLFIIARGRVEVRVSVDGAHRRLATLGPGQFFGEMSLMTGAHRTATCTALTDTVCYVIDQPAFRCVLDTRPSLAEDISSILAERQVELDESREGLGVEARARRARDARSHLLTAIRRAFAI